MTRTEIEHLLKNIGAIETHVHSDESLKFVKHAYFAARATSGVPQNDISAFILGALWYKNVHKAADESFMKLYTERSYQVLELQKKLEQFQMKV
jgi:hypothetical protein